MVRAGEGLYEGQVTQANLDGFGRFITFYGNEGIFMFVGYFKPFPKEQPGNNFYSLSSGKGTGVLSNIEKVMNSGFYDDYEKLNEDEIPMVPSWDSSWKEFWTGTI